MSWWPWSKKENLVVEQKSGATLPPYVTRAGLFEKAGYYDLSFYVLNRYYKTCAPLADAIDTIARDVASMRPVVWDKEDKVYIDDHDVLELLEYPNTMQTYFDFMLDLATGFQIAGNHFLEQVGNPNKPPLSIETRAPMYSNLQPNSYGELGTIAINTPFISDLYTLESHKRRSRYYNKSRDKEMWPILDYNPDKGSQNFYGMPKAQSLYYDIEQYIASGNHNKNLLENGARPSGVMTSKNVDPLTDEQFTRMQNQLDAYYAGTENAGRVMLAEWFEYKDMIVSNRDMDFKELRDGVKQMIYLRFGVPLPAVSVGTMTFSNYETSQVAEYDNTAIPLSKFLLGQITNAVMYRYEPESWKRYCITIDDTQVGALGAVRTKNIETMKKVGVNTVNELRTKLGYDEIENGDIILRPANEVPALDGEDNTDEEAEGEELQKQLDNAVNAKGEHR